MSAVDTPYIIAVIRSLEQGLLQEDEYTRLIQAPSREEALRVLVDTPYGQWLEPGASAAATFAALMERLVKLQRWLVDVVLDPTVMELSQARYDGLNVATALVAKARGEEEPGELSRLGRINPDLLQSTIWNDTGWDDLPEVWESFIRGELAHETLQTTVLLARVQQQVVVLFDLAAQTPLAEAYTRLTRDRLVVDQLLRERPVTGLEATSLAEAGLTAESTVAQISAALQQADYEGFTESMLQEVRDGVAAGAYELAWDAELAHLFKQYRWEPVGYDPILAFWLAVELEAKTIRLILTAKLQGLPTEDIEPLKRPLYLTST